MMGSIPADDRPCCSSYTGSYILAKALGCVTALWEPARLPHNRLEASVTLRNNEMKTQLSCRVRSGQS